MTNNMKVDPSGYTQGDLINALWRWQLEADYISSIAEDLPEGALERACRSIFGDEDGEHVEHVINEVYHLPAPLDAAVAEADKAIVSQFVN